MEFCVAEFLSVSASFGVSEETDAGMTFSVKVVAGLSAWSYTFLRDLFSSACCARFSSNRERETLLYFLFLGGPICGGCFPGVSVDAQTFDVFLSVAGCDCCISWGGVVSSTEASPCSTRCSGLCHSLHEGNWSAEHCRGCCVSWWLDQVSASAWIWCVSRTLC